MKTAFHLLIVAALLLSACGEANNNAAKDQPEVSESAKAAAMAHFEQAKELMENVNANTTAQTYETAIEALTAAIKADPTNELFYLYRSTCNGRLSRPKSAISDLNTVVELDPEFAVAYRNRGGLKYQLQDFEGAEADFTKLIELKPDDGNAFYNRAAVRGQMGNPNACKDFERAIELALINEEDILYKRYCTE